MSCDPCEFEKYMNGPPTNSVQGEWVKMIFPVGCLPICTDSLEPNPSGSSLLSLLRRVMPAS